MQITKPYTKEEFEQIFKLNYDTFVEEIPQHTSNDEKVLVDKFHSKNNYLIAKKDKQVIGMICFSSERPFSLDQKLPDMDKLLPSYNKIAEIRLLSVKSENRNGTTAYRLLKKTSEELMKQQFDIAVISGTTRQLPLYKKIGFVEFGPLVGADEALFQPMYITLKQLRSDFKSN